MRPYYKSKAGECQGNARRIAPVRLESGTGRQRKVKPDVAPRQEVYGGFRTGEIYPANAARTTLALNATRSQDTLAVYLRGS
ncbi:MAG: hypothetical protein ROW48_17280 [Bellilinea sp.]